MRKVVSVILLILTVFYSSVSYGQSVPNGPIVQGQSWTIQQWNNAWTTKQDLLGFTPLNPANNLNDVQSSSTARSNLGLGTAATANVGTSGTSLCLLSTNCTYNGLQTFSSGISTTSITGLATPLGTAVGGIGTSNGDISGLTATSSGTSAASSLASHFARQIWITDFDANACSSVNYDSSAAFNAAIQWMVANGPGVILFPKGICKIGNSNFPTFVIGSGVSLQGMGTGATTLAAGLTNANPLIRLGGNGDSISNLTINASNSGTNTTGITIQMGTSGTLNSGFNQQMVSNVSINGPCIGIDLNGSLITVKDTVISGFAGSGCGGVRVGSLTTGGNTNNIFVSNVWTASSQSTPADYGFQVLDANSPVFSNITNLYAKYGMEIVPGANQSAQWGNVVASQVGYINVNQALLIQPNSVSAVVTGFRFVDDWFAINTTGDLVALQNNVGATMKDTDFSHDYFLHTPGNSITVGNNTGGVMIGGASLICVYNAAGINLQAGASGVQVVGTKINPSCVGQVGTGTKAVNFGGSNNFILFTGNDINGNSATLPFGGVPTGNNTIIGNNLGIDNTFVTLTTSALSGSTLDLTSGGTVNALSPVFSLNLSGGSTISTISNPGWQGRQFLLINSGSGSITIGGGVNSGGGVLPNPGKSLAIGDVAYCYYNGSYVNCH